ncbi:hypothetical protein K469DRAFT_691746 [Zopfia rhizophila CBS 207.26]|uniref:Uncharacterized protein n=1 Tax=Zopfia rhizophila CBS 207.26 TaxID=1314779 RepID=A0A6A6DTE1_9PEZI|nr:hypothetical protein K469DRAFT_691746 [Zopfia rhizophila CBS 207.26]
MRDYARGILKQSPRLAINGDSSLSQRSAHLRGPEKSTNESQSSSLHEATLELKAVVENMNIFKSKNLSAQEAKILDEAESSSEETPGPSDVETEVKEEPFEPDAPDTPTQGISEGKARGVNGSSHNVDVTDGTTQEELPKQPASDQIYQTYNGGLTPLFITDPFSEGSLPLGRGSPIDLQLHEVALTQVNAPSSSNTGPSNENFSDSLNHGYVCNSDLFGLHYLLRQPHRRPCAPIPLLHLASQERRPTAAHLVA